MLSLIIQHLVYIVTYPIYLPDNIEHYAKYNLQWCYHGSTHLVLRAVVHIYAAYIFSWKLCQEMKEFSVSQLFVNNVMFKRHPPH